MQKNIQMMGRSTEGGLQVACFGYGQYFTGGVCHGLRKSGPVTATKFIVN